MKFTTAIPLWEQWDFVALFESYYSGGHWFLQLFIPYNGHLHSFPFLVSLSLGVLTHWNILFEIYLGFFLLCSCFLILESWLRRMGEALYNLLLPFLSIFWFSLRFHEVSFNGFDTTIYYISALLILATLTFLSQSSQSYRSFLFGLGTAVLLNFSWGGGQLIWPAGLLLLWFQLDKRRKLTMTSLWILGGIGVSAITSILRHIPNLLVGFDLTKFLRFSASLAGTPFTHKVSVSFAIFVLFTIIGCLFLRVRVGWNPLKTSAAPWVALGTYALLNIPAIALARMQNPIEISTKSRYSFILTPLAVSLLVLITAGLENGVGIAWFTQKRRQFAIIFSLLALSAFSVTASFRTYREVQGYWRLIQPLARLASSNPGLLTPGCFLGLVSYRPKNVLEGLQIMRTHRLALFRHSPGEGLRALTATSSKVSNRNSEWLQVELKKIKYFPERRYCSISGKAIDLRTNNPPPFIYVSSPKGREIAISGFPGHFPGIQNTFLGFKLNIPVSDIPRKNPELRVIVLASDGLRQEIPVRFPQIQRGSQTKHPKIFSSGFDDFSNHSWTLIQPGFMAYPSLS